VKVSVVNPGSVDTFLSPKKEGADTSWKLAAGDVAECIAQVVSTPPNVLQFQVEVRALKKGG
jgi:hypothetical protein